MAQLKLVFQPLLALGVVAGIVFISAGRWDLPFVWVILAEIWVFYILLAAVGDSGMIRERQAPAAANQDRVTQPLGAACLLSHWVVGGLDVGRWHWSLVPWQLQLAGVIGYGAALSVNLWAIRCNPFYSSVVRVQTDRDQRAVSVGPYRFVRHPGYAATICATLLGGMAMGSWIGMLPIVGFALLFVRRTLLEDRLLQRELPGYANYAQSVRFMLVAGVF